MKAVIIGAGEVGCHIAKFISLTSVIREGDKVIVFALSFAVSAVEKFFK
jgi:hypothetical protein